MASAIRNCAVSGALSTSNQASTMSRVPAIAAVTSLRSRRRSANHPVRSSRAHNNTSKPTHETS
jgi:hypothetical protein